MKKAFKILIISTLSISAFSQSATILPSRMDVPNVPALPICDVTGKGRMVFNTSDNKMYFCNGTAWTDMTVGGFTLPYAGSGNATAPNILFGITNSANGRAISGVTTSSTYGNGVYGASTNTAPSSANPSSIGVFGINNSQNANGIGVYGQHDGTGKGIYGVVRNGGIGVHGIGLPVSSGGNGNGIGVKGESTNSTGVRGESSSGYGVHATSNTGAALYGSTGNNYGAYFDNSSLNTPTIYAYNFGGGRAAFLDGNVRVGNNLEVDGTTTLGSTTNVNGTLNANGNLVVDGTATVNNGKGVVYNSTNSTNLKIYTFTTATFVAALPGFGLSPEGAIAFNGGFTGTPRVFVGDIDQTGGSAGELYRVQLQLYGCSTISGLTSCKARLLNTSPNPVNYSITWNCMAIGN
jgi:hypothetical protein